MISVFTNSMIPDDERRKALFAGDLFTYSASPSSLRLVEFARGMIEEAFAPFDPRDAQHSMSPEKYFGILADLKPRLINHERSKLHIRETLEAHGCDVERTFFDVPRVQSATSDGYLTSGFAYAFPPHRDTWYAGPLCQINWWVPIYPIEPGCALSIHPRYWDEAVLNSSNEYDYDTWKKTGRKQVAHQVRKDTRNWSQALQRVELEPEIRVVVEPGGLLLFSGAHLHGTVPNQTGRTRFSLDFRSVHQGDVVSGVGAPNLDSACSGTTLGDYFRVRDLARIPARVIAEYSPEAPRLVASRAA